MNVLCFITGSRAFDGQRDYLGRPLEFLPGGNPGSVINHSKMNPNCIVVDQEVDGRLRLFVQTTKTVAAGVQLVYDYNDRRRGLDKSLKWLDK